MELGIDAAPTAAEGRVYRDRRWRVSGCAGRRDAARTTAQM